MNKKKGVVLFRCLFVCFVLCLIPFLIFTTPDTSPKPSSPSIESRIIRGSSRTHAVIENPLRRYEKEKEGLICLAVVATDAKVSFASDAPIFSNLLPSLLSTVESSKVNPNTLFSFRIALGYHRGKFSVLIKLINTRKQVL